MFDLTLENQSTIAAFWTPEEQRQFVRVRAAQSAEKKGASPSDAVHFRLNIESPAQFKAWAQRVEVAIGLFALEVQRVRSSLPEKLVSKEVLASVDWHSWQLIKDFRYQILDILRSLSDVAYGFSQDLCNERLSRTQSFLESPTHQTWQKITNIKCKDEPRYKAQQRAYHKQEHVREARSHSQRRREQLERLEGLCRRWLEATTVDREQAAGLKNELRTRLQEWSATWGGSDPTDAIVTRFNALATALRDGGAQ